MRWVAPAAEHHEPGRRRRSRARARSSSRSPPVSGGRSGGSCRGPSAYALVLRPVNEPIPIDTSEPMPGGRAAREPGQRQLRAPDAGRLDQDHGRDQRRAEDERDGGEAPGRGDTMQRLLGHLPARRRIVRSAQFPSPRAISGASGPSTSPSPMVASPARITPGRSISCGSAAAHREAVRREVSAARRAGARSRARRGGPRARARAAATTAAGRVCSRARSAGAT